MLCWRNDCFGLLTKPFIVQCSVACAGYKVIYGQPLDTVMKYFNGIPLICEEMHFRLIGRKKFFTAGRVGPLLPPGKLAVLRGRTLKKRRHTGY